MATILDLLQALNRGDLPPLPPPAPSMPIPLTTAGQPATPQYQFNPIPEMAPQAPAPGLDMGFVNQYAGQAPTAPTLNEPTTIDKIAAVLGGIAYGPGYAQSLREERQRPQREYEAARERYQGRRAQALELAQRKQERQQELTQRRAEQQAERDFKVWVQKTGVTDEMAIQQMRNAFQLERDARAEVENQRKERALLKRQTDLQIDDRIKAYRDQGAGKYAEELARSDFRRALTDLGETVPPLSKAAEKANVLVQAKLQRALRLAQGGTGGGSSKNEVELVDANGNPLMRMPYEKVKFGTYGEVKGFPEGTQVRPIQPKQPQPQRQAPQIPNPIAELGAQVMPVAPAAKPELNNRQRAKFNDIKREQPEFTDEQIFTYMQKKGWL